MSPENVHFVYLHSPHFLATIFLIMRAIFNIWFRNFTHPTRTKLLIWWIFLGFHNVFSCKQVLVLPFCYFYFKFVVYFQASKITMPKQLQRSVQFSVTSFQVLSSLTNFFEDTCYVLSNLSEWNATVLCQAEQQPICGIAALRKLCWLSDQYRSIEAMLDIKPTIHYCSVAVQKLIFVQMDTIDCCFIAKNRRIYLKYSWKTHLAETVVIWWTICINQSTREKHFSTNVLEFGDSELDNS